MVLCDVVEDLSCQ